MSEEHQAYMTARCLEYTVHFCVFYDSRLFSCCFTVGGDLLEGQLVNSLVPQIVIYLHIYSARTRVLSSRTWWRKTAYVHVLCSSTGPPCMSEWDETPNPIYSAGSTGFVAVKE